jgi:type I restriction enzyme S subunit
MLTAADIGDGFVNYEKARHTVRRDFMRLSSKSRPSVGDLLVTKDGTLGRVAILDREDVCVNQSVAVLSGADAASAAYLALYLRSPIGQERMLADAGGSTIKHIYITTLAEMSVPWPDRGEAAQIVQRVAAMESRLVCEEAQLKKMSLAKWGRMDDLLTGRVRVTPLLERTQAS